MAGNTHAPQERHRIGIGDAQGDKSLSWRLVVRDRRRLTAATRRLGSEELSPSLLEASSVAALSR